MSDAEDRRLLVDLGAAMIAGGHPVHEVEAELRALAGGLGYPGAQVGATPTGISLALAPGGAATFEAVGGPLLLDQSAEVGAIRREIIAGQVTVDEALDRLGRIRSLPRRYPGWLAAGAWILIPTGIALILQPGVGNVAAAALGGVVVLALVKLTERYRVAATLLPTVAAFLVAVGIFAAADAGLLTGPLRTMLAPLAILLPGGLMVTGMSELAAGAMVAGSARLTYGVVQLLLFALGVLSAATVLRVAPAQLVNQRVNELGWWAVPVGLAVLSLAVCLAESVPLRLLPWISAMVALAFAAQSLGQWLSGPALGGFCGAVTASVGASLVALVRPALPRLVVFLPSFWLLVPGSVGLMSVTRLGLDPGQGARTVIDVVAVVASIALGLLVGSAIFQALASVVRRP